MLCAGVASQRVEVVSTTAVNKGLTVRGEGGPAKAVADFAAADDEFAIGLVRLDRGEWSVRASGDRVHPEFGEGCVSDDPAGPIGLRPVPVAGRVIQRGPGRTCPR